MEADIKRKEDLRFDTADFRSHGKDSRIDTGASSINPIIFFLRQKIRGILINLNELPTITC